MAFWWVHPTDLTLCVKNVLSASPSNVCKDTFLRKIQRTLTYKMLAFSPKKSATSSYM